MASELLRRRDLLQAKMTEDYPGFGFGVLSTSSNKLTVPTALSPLIDIPSNCASLTVAYKFPTNTAVGIMHVFTNSVYKDQWGATSNNSRTIPITAGKFDQCIIMVNLDEIDNCYLKDNTNNTYLWKGKNVT